MFARVTTIQGTPDRLTEEASQDFQARAEGEWRQLEGFTGATLLIDRTSGKVMAISFWESEAAMQASEAAVTGARTAAAQQLGAPPTVERYEVAVQV